MKELREGFGIAALLLSPAMMEQELPTEEEGGGGQQKGSDAAAKSDAAKSRWKKAATKAVLVNALTKPKKAVAQNDKCWDDSDPAAAPGTWGVSGVLASDPLVQASSPKYPPSAYAPLDRQPRVTTTSQQAGPYTTRWPLAPQQSFARGGGDFLHTAPLDPVAEGFSACDSEPHLLIRVQRANYSGVTVLSKLFGGGGGNSQKIVASGNVMVRLSCRGRAVSVSVDRRGMALANAQSLAIPAAEGSESGYQGLEMRAELVGSGGKLAEGFVEVKRLMAVGEQQRMTDGGGEGGFLTEVALFSVDGKRNRTGSIEVVIVWKDRWPEPVRAGEGPQVMSLSSGGVPHHMQFEPQQQQHVQQASPTYGLQSAPYQGFAQQSLAPTSFASHAFGFPPPTAGGVGGKPAGLLRINECSVMDVMLDAALKMSKCGANRLLIDGPWKWLIQQFAVHFNVSVPYTLMAHLRSRSADSSSPPASFPSRHCSPALQVGA